jgi:DNA-binding LacI/PurR family transcriptional regulator
VRDEVAHLLSLGHRRIGYVNGPVAHGNSAERLAGYRAALKAAKVAYDRRLVTSAPFTIEGGYEAAARLLSLDDSPTALALANDYMALGAVQAVRARGLSVPRDVSVAGFDDFVVASLVDPPLTTVRVPMRQMGARAMQLLLDEIARRRAASAGGGAGAPDETPAEPASPEYVPTELVVRGSTAALCAAA